MGRRTFGSLCVLALAGMPLQAGAHDADRVSIQLVNPAEAALIRLQLDRRLIYEGAPTREELGVHGAIAVMVGSFDLRDGRRHVLVAEAPATRVKVQLEWSPQHRFSPWVVIRYQPSRPTSGEPAFFAVSLQDAAYKLK